MRPGAHRFVGHAAERDAGPSAALLVGMTIDFTSPYLNDVPVRGLVVGRTHAERVRGLLLVALPLAEPTAHMWGGRWVVAPILRRERRCNLAAAARRLDWPDGTRLLRRGRRHALRC
jgi:hypothetical protein